MANFLFIFRAHFLLVVCACLHTRLHKRCTYRKFVFSQIARVVLDERLTINVRKRENERNEERSPQLMRKCDGHIFCLFVCCLKLSSKRLRLQTFLDAVRPQVFFLQQIGFMKLFSNKNAHVEPLLNVIKTRKTRDATTTTNHDVIVYVKANKKIA